ncbi:MAG: Smr/MutS family protein, partial [Oscillospiraceae bacterium]|nr:Smr/MutS family protein [Oscillospiraceae bacterium]
ELGDSFDTLVITGPNTGGKTVSIKTIGLLAAMHQCGLHIPAADGSNLPVFTHILADIGDEQSIEPSLSTFSAHMSNIVSIIDECDENSLVLFDELGAGTDPTEGAALAIAIIEHVRRRGAVIAATTHYAELKVYATNEPGVQNASCEFDVETLRPTYRLLVGIPGKSNAFAISKRLGLGDEIIEDAKNRVSSESQTFELTIEKLEQTRLLLEKDREETAKKLREAQENAKKSNMLRAELEVRLDKADIKSRREAERILSDARATAEEVFRELDEMRKMADQDEDASRVNEARAQLRRQLNLSQEALQRELHPEAQNQVSSRPVQVGDTVQLKSMGIKATVLSKSADGTLSLRAGIMNVSAKEDEVLLLENEQAPKPKSTSKGGGGQMHSMSIASELDIRGMEALEGVLAAERYLDSAVMAKLKTVTIIHGKGTGALRTAVQQMLKKNKFVKSFRLGRYGEGESGVTVVELK